MSVPPSVPSRSRRISLSSFSAFTDLGVAAVNAARVSRQPVAVLLVEVEHFERIDRTHGPQFAESLFETVTQRVRAVLRPRDHSARRQAGQLVVLLPGTGGAAAVELGGRVVEAVRSHRFAPGSRSREMRAEVAVGIGVAPLHGDSFPALLAAAERALARAVGRSGGTVMMALDPASEPLHPPLALDRFIGRADQLRTLVGALDEAVEGRMQAVVVHGDAGVGCSTLVAQLAPEARIRGGMLVRGAARRLPVRPPYGVWASVLESLHRHAAIPVHGWRELPHLVPALGSGASADAVGGSQYRLLEELATCLADAAAVRPLVVALDDMQWADEASWDALEHLTTRLRTAGIVFVVALQSDQRDPATLERRQKLRLAGAHDIPLSRLTRDEVKRWVEGAFGQEVAREFLSFVYRHGEGNPLIITHLLRALVEEGAVRHTGERWEWRPVSELQVPAGLDALVQRRLVRLGARAQLAVAAAAVIGREFDRTTLASVLGADAPHVEAVVQATLEAGLLRAAGDPCRVDCDAYVLAHVRLADIVLAQLPPQRIRRTHQRVAEAIERTVVPDERPATAIEIATHYDQAGVPEGAYAAAIRAADHAERVYARGTAAELLRLAARNAGSPAALAAVRTRLATLAELAGLYDEAEELCDLAIEWYAGQEEVARSLALRTVRERLRSQLGQPARRTLETLLALDREAAAHGLTAERVAILTLLSQTHGRLGDSGSAERIAADCVATAEAIGDPALLADSLNRYAITMELEDPERAKAIFQRALVLYEARADYRGQARIHNNIGIVAQLQGRLEEAAAALATAIALARTAGMPDFWGAAALNLGVMTMKSGEFDRARELLSEALSLFATVKNSELQLYALYNLAHLERERGEPGTAAELYDTAVSLAQRIGQVDVEAGALGGGGLSLLELGRVEEATARLSSAEARVEDRADWFLGRELIELLAIRIALLQERPGAALERFERAVAIAESSDLYGAAWLTAECAPLLAPHGAGAVRQRVARYADRVGELGFPDMSRRYARLAGAS